MSSLTQRASALSGCGLQDTVATAPDRALGTASWFRFPDGHKPVWRRGDLWLSRLPDGGAPVGMRDDRHVFVCAGPRAGKDASIVIPNLLLWAGSVVVIDPKGENAVVTARRRGHGSRFCEGMGQKVHILDPFGVVQTKYDDFADLKRCFNPITLLRADDERSVSKAAQIAESFVVSEGSKDAFWDDAGRYCIEMVMLHVATSRDILDRERHLGTVRGLLVAGDVGMRRLMMANAVAGQEVPTGLELLFADMAGNPAFAGLIARAGERYAGLLATSPRALASTFEVACTHTNFLDDPAVARCLMRSDFDLAELKGDPDGVSLYLSLPQSQMHAQFRLLRVMVTLIVAEAEKSLTQPACGHPVLMVLNEFAGLKRMRVIEDAAAQIAGYSVKLMTIVQTLPQLKDLYKDNWETFVGNAGVRLFFGNDDHFTRDYVSKLLGECEVTRRTASFNETQGGSFTSSTSKSSGTTSSVSQSRTTGSSSAPGGVSFSTTTTSGWTHGISYTTTKSASAGTSWSQSHGWSETIHKRLLLNPDEVGRLFGDRDRPAAIALLSGLPPMALARTWYFRDPAFAGRFDPHDAYPPPMTLAALRKYRIEEAERQAAERANAERARRIREDFARITQTIEAAKTKRIADAQAAERDREMKAQRAERERRERREGAVILSVGFLGMLTLVILTDYIFGNTGANWLLTLIVISAALLFFAD